MTFNSMAMGVGNAVTSTVGKEDRHVDDVVPTRAGVLQNKPHVFKNGTALRRDVVARHFPVAVQRHARNFFAAPDPWPDARKKQQMANPFRVRKRSDWFRCARTFNGRICANRHTAPQIATRCGGCRPQIGFRPLKWTRRRFSGARAGRP